MWDGELGNAFWIGAKNWDGDSVPTTSDSILFNDTFVVTPPTIDLRGDRTVNGTLGFSGAISYVLTNGTLTVGASVTNNASANMTVFVPIILSGDRTFQMDGSGDFAINNTISGSGSLTKEGAGVLSLNADNTFSGSFVLNAGTVQFGADNANGAGALQINAGTIVATGGNRSLDESVVVGGDFAIGGANQLTLSGGMDLGSSTRSIAIDNSAPTLFSGVISGTGGITKTGNGTLTLTGGSANSYSGETRVTAGTLVLNKTGASAIAGTLVIGESSGSPGEDIVQLAGANQIADSVLVTIHASGQLDLAGHNETLGNFASTSTASQLALGTSGTNTLTFGTADSHNFAGSISGSGALLKQGVGTVTLTGANTYTGTTTVNAGLLLIENGAALGDAASGTLISNGAGLQLQGGITVANESLELNGDGVAAGGALQNLTGNNTWNGAITINSDARVHSSSGTLSLGGSVSGASAQLTLSGAGDIAINGAVDLSAGSVSLDGTGTVTLGSGGTYSGASLSLNSGNLSLGASDRIDDAVAVNVGSSFLLNGSFSEQVGLLSYDHGLIDFGSAGTTNYFLFSGGGTQSGLLTIQNWEQDIDQFAFSSSGSVSSDFLANLYFAGYGAGGFISATNQSISSYLGDWSFISPISNFQTWDGGATLLSTWDAEGGANWVGDVLPASSSNLKLAFSGTQRLTPDLHADYTANTLRFNSGAGSFNLGSSTGKTLTFDGVLPSIIQLSSNGQTISHALTLNTDLLISAIGSGSLTIAGTMGGAGGIETIGSSTVRLSGANTYAGVTTISLGTINIGNGAALGSTNAGTIVAFGAALELQDNIVVAGEALTVNGSGTAGGGALRNVSGVNSWSGTVALGSDSRINSDSGELTLSGTVSGTSHTLSAGGAGNMVISGSLDLGTGALVKDGAGSLTLSGSTANAFSGGTTINEGSVLLSKNSGIDALSGSLVIGDGTGGSGADLLQLNSDHQIADTSSMTILSSGKFDLNNRTETIASISGSSPSALLSLGESIVGGGALTIGGADSTTFAGVISGTGSMIKDGTGTLTLTGENTFIGDVTINDGALRIGTSSALGTAYEGTLVNAGGSLELYNGITISSEFLSLNGSGVDSGGAMRNVSQNNIWSGAISLAGSTRIHSDSGTLTLGGSLSTEGHNLTLGGSGSITVSGVVQGTGSLVKDGTGTAELAAANLYTGGTHISAGTLSLGNDTALGTGAVSLSGGALAASGAPRVVANTVALAGNASISGNQNLTFSGKWTQTDGSYTLTIDNSGTSTLIGGLDLSNNSTGRTLTLDVAGGGLNINSVIADGGAAAGNLVKAGAGTLTLSQPNTFTGTTTLNAGTIAIAGNELLADSSDLNIAGGTFNLGGYTERVATFDYNGGTLKFGSPGSTNHFLFAQAGGSTPSSPIILYDWETGIDRFAFQSGSSNTISTAFLENIYFAGFGAVATTSDPFQLIDGYGSDWTFLLPSEQFYDTWDGGHATKNEWSRHANWADDSAPIGGITTKVAFDGSLRLSPDLDDHMTINSLRFNTNASAFNLVSLTERTLTFDGILPSIMQRSPNNQTISHSVELATTTFIDTTGAGTLTFGGVISGTGGIQKVGSSTVIFSGTNTFTGALDLYSGVVNLRTSEALGSSSGGTTVHSGGALQLQNGVSIASEALTLNGSGIADDGALRNISGTNTWAGSILLSGNSRVNSDAGKLLLTGPITSPTSRTLSVGGASDTEITGAITTSGGGLTKDGTGTLTLSGSGDNTYTGTTAVNEGTLLLAKSGGSTAISGPLVVGDGSGGAAADILRLNAANQIADTAAVTVNSSGQFDLNGNNEAIGSLALDGGSVVTGAGTLTLDGNVSSSANSAPATISGALDLNGGTRTFTIADGATASDVQISATIANGGIQKSGDGTLVLSGNNTYAGTTTVSGGTLNTRTASALGSTTGGTVVQSGGALEVQDGIAIGNETLTLAGSGILNGGALRSVSGDNSWAGAINLSADSTIASDSGSLTLTGTLNNGGTLLTVSGAGDISVQNVISGAGGLTKEGAGTLTFSAANTFTGQLTVSDGTLLLGANNVIASTVDLALDGGTLNTGGNSQNLATLSLSSDSTIDLGSGASILQFSDSSAAVWGGGLVLTINSWSGSRHGAGIDQFYIGSDDSGLTEIQVGQIRFFNPAGFDPGLYEARLLPTGEIVPVPEPATVTAIIALSLVLIWRERKTIAHILRNPLRS